MDVTTPVATFESLERRRVARHIRRAEAAARRRDVSGLDPLRRLVRSLLLDELARYRADGRFPRNRGFAEATPYFVDADGARCAVAHLMEAGGEAGLVARIARERNHARVPELASEPRLVAWLDAAGLTLGEAALIQPGYCAPMWTCVCGGWFAHTPYVTPARGVLEVVAGPVDAGSYTFGARVTATHGDAAGYAVGQVVVVGQVVGGTAREGARLLVPLSAGDAGADGHGAVLLAPDGTYTCRSSSSGTAAPPLTRDQLVRAVTSASCEATVTAYGSDWRRSDCASEGRGCGAAPGAGGEPPTTLGVLCALTAAVVARRARRRA